MALLDGHADIVGRTIICRSIENDGGGSDVAGRGGATHMEHSDQRHHQSAEKPQQSCGLHHDAKQGDATTHGAE